MSPSGSATGFALRLITLEPNLRRYPSTSPQLQTFYFDPTPSMTSANLSRFSLVPVFFFPPSCFPHSSFLVDFMCTLHSLFSRFHAPPYSSGVAAPFFSLITCKGLKVCYLSFKPPPGCACNRCNFHYIMFRALLYFFLQLKSILSVSLRIYLHEMCSRQKTACFHLVSPYFESQTERAAEDGPLSDSIHCCFIEKHQITATILYRHKAPQRY